MKELAYFTTGFLIAISLAIIMNIPDQEIIPDPDYGYNNPGYFIERVDEGWCADRVIRRAQTYVATYCAGEFGRIPVNIPFYDHPHFDSVFVKMIAEVDSLAGVGIW